MKEKIITEIINEMLPALNNGQLKKLKDVLEVNLYNVAIVTRKDEENEPETQDYLEIFLSAKNRGMFREDFNILQKYHSSNDGKYRKNGMHN